MEITSPRRIELLTTGMVRLFFRLSNRVTRIYCTSVVSECSEFEVYWVLFQILPASESIHYFLHGFGESDHIQTCDIYHYQSSSLINELATVIFV